jgi:hypothetical protein
MAAALALLGQQGGASAQSRQDDLLSANGVMPGCREEINTSNVFLRGYCLGSIRVMLYLHPRLFFCAPSGATVGQALRVVVLYIDQRPARLHERFEDLALEALQQAWPCPK